jgi:methylmalonyl-CoA/ethylmalonyl-CoA epimerase
MVIMNRNLVIQVAFLVSDCKEAAENWAKLLQVETPEVTSTDGPDKTNASYKGKRCEGMIYQAIFKLDNLMLELIQPYGDEPSIWKDCFDENGEGFHHIAFHTEDIKEDMAALAAQGIPSQAYGEWNDGAGKYSYHDARKSLGIIFELLEGVDAPLIF